MGLVGNSSSTRKRRLKQESEKWCRGAASASVSWSFSCSPCVRDVPLCLFMQTAEEKVPVWYIMDEFGSRIQHSDQPSFAAAPLFYMPQQIAYTVLWPLRDLETGGECVSEELGFSLKPAIENGPVLTKSLNISQ